MSYREIYDIIAFRSRSYALKFSQVLKTAGYVNHHIVSTPKEISVGCGLSIKFGTSMTPYVMGLYKIYEYPISGFYRIERIGSMTNIIRIPV